MPPPQKVRIETSEFHFMGENLRHNDPHTNRLGSHKHMTLTNSCRYCKPTGELGKVFLCLGIMCSMGWHHITLRKGVLTNPLKSPLHRQACRHSDRNYTVFCST